MFKLIKTIFWSLKKILSGIARIITGVAVLLIVYYIIYRLCLFFGIILPWFF